MAALTFTRENVVATLPDFAEIYDAVMALELSGIDGGDIRVVGDGAERAAELATSEIAVVEVQSFRRLVLRMTAGALIGGLVGAAVGLLTIGSSTTSRARPRLARWSGSSCCAPRPGRSRAASLSRRHCRPPRRARPDRPPLTAVPASSTRQAPLQRVHGSGAARARTRVRRVSEFAGSMALVTPGDNSGTLGEVGRSVTGLRVARVSDNRRR